MTVPHCKVCDLADFEDSRLADLIREIFASDRAAFAPSKRSAEFREFPRGREYRKYWEVSMTARAFGDLGVLRDDAQVLGVGAGHEATVFWLTREVGRVVATDLYRTEDTWSESDSGEAMLTDPGRYWDGPWNPQRLDARHMDALDLDFPDESFDGVFSSSSIEHFGDFADVRRGIEEIYRVLKPGGVAALSTEFRFEGPTPGWPGVLMFDEPQLRSLLLDGLWWDPATPLVTSVSAQTLAAPVDLQEALAEQEAGGRGWSRYPHLVLRSGPYLWTSVHVALVKSRQDAAQWRERGPELRRKNPRWPKLPGSVAGRLAARARERTGRARVRVGALLGR